MLLVFFLTMGELPSFCLSDTHSTTGRLFTENWTGPNRRTFFDNIPKLQELPSLFKRLFPNPKSEIFIKWVPTTPAPPTAVSLPPQSYQVPPLEYQIPPNSNQGPSDSYGPPSMIVLPGGQIQDNSGSRPSGLPYSNHVDGENVPYMTPSVNTMYAVPSNMQNIPPNGNNQNYHQIPMTPCRHNEQFKPSHLLEISGTDSNMIDGFSSHHGVIHVDSHFPNKPHIEIQSNYGDQMNVGSIPSSDQQYILDPMIHSQSHFNGALSGQTNYPEINNDMYQTFQLNDATLNYMDSDYAAMNNAYGSGNNVNQNFSTNSDFQSPLMTSIILPDEQHVGGSPQLVPVSSGYDTFSESDVPTYFVSAPIHAATFMAHPVHGRSSKTRFGRYAHRPGRSATRVAIVPYYIRSERPNRLRRTQLNKNSNRSWRKTLGWPFFK